MSRLQSRQELKEALLPKELLLYEAVQSPMAFFMPFFLGLLGGLSLVPQVWDGIGLLLSEKAQSYIPIGKHTFSEMYFGVVLISAASGLLITRYRAANNNFYFLTNIRMVVRSKSWFREDFQFIMLHRLRTVRIKAGILGRLMQMGKMILEDDRKLERIEIANVDSPKRFKEAIMKAKHRFGEYAERIEEDGFLIQVQSEKSAREERKRRRKAQQKQKRQEQQRREDEVKARKAEEDRNSGYY